MPFTSLCAAVIVETLINHRSEKNVYHIEKLCQASDENLRPTAQEPGVKVWYIEI